MSGRNTGKFKVKRGGGRSFSRDLSRLDENGNNPNEAKESSSEESSSESEDEATNRQNRVGQLPPIIDSESEDDEIDGLTRNVNASLSTAPKALPAAAPTLSNSRLGEMTAEKVAAARKERKAAKSNAPVSKVKADDDSGSELEENANNAKVRNLKTSDLGAPRELSRREREAADKLAAKERYAKLHAAGKTDEAKSDLGRLQLIKKQREIAAAKRLAETAVKDEAAKIALEKSGKRVPLKR